MVTNYTEEIMYSTFLRSCRNWQEFSSAEKIIQESDLTYNEAKLACLEFNDNRSDAEIAIGRKLEFTLTENL